MSARRRRFSLSFLSLFLALIATSCAPSEVGTIDLSASKAKAEASTVSKEAQGKTKRGRGGIPIAQRAPEARQNSATR